MNISPNTKIVICQDVPLDNTYEHTIHFGYAREYQHMADQYNYFYSKRKYVFEPTTYQRVNSNTLRIQMIADNLYNCNYLMFQNTNFRTENTHYTGDKWFYAFITSVNYINNAVTEITYEIDVMQTWMFDYVISSAYVERQHSGTDNIGDNLIPEPIVPSDYKTESELIWPVTTPTGVQGTFTPKSMLLATQRPTGHTGSRLKLLTQVDGIACHIYYLIADMDTQSNYIDEELQDFISEGEEEAVIGIFAVPPMFTKDNAHVTTPISVMFSRTRQYGGDFDGYVPKNNKMYTYPYNKMKVENSFGQNKEYRFEYFYHEQNGDIEFTGKASALPKPCLIVYPQNYANNVGNVEEALSVGEYPQGVFSGDSYQLWLHRGFIQDVASVGSAGVSTAMTMGTADYVGTFIGLRNLFSTSLNTVAHALQADYTPDKMYGNLDATAPYYGIPAGFSFKFKTLRPNYSQAKMIDDFFTRFGYAQNKIMTVDTYTRTHWTYTKTLDCTIVGSVPADDMAKIRDIFNNGITWWVNPSEIGDFTLNNAPRY